MGAWVHGWGEVKREGREDTRKLSGQPVNRRVSRPPWPNLHAAAVFGASAYKFESTSLANGTQPESSSDERLASDSAGSISFS